MPKADGGRDRLKTNDISLRDTICLLCKLKRKADVFF